MLRSAALATLVLLGAGCRSSATERAAPLRLIDGPGVAALAARSDAQVVVVNLWATWCGPCKEEMPMFVEVGRSYAERGVELHFVSLDFLEEAAAAAAFLASQEVPLPSWIKEGRDHPFITAVHPEWSGALPATLVYDGEGRLRSFWEGKIDRPTLTGALDALIEGPGPTE